MPPGLGQSFPDKGWLNVEVAERRTLVPFVDKHLRNWEAGFEKNVATILLMAASRYGAEQTPNRIADLDFDRVMAFLRYE